jgi:hypothetical protein
LTQPQLSSLQTVTLAGIVRLLLHLLRPLAFALVVFVFLPYKLYCLLAASHSLWLLSPSPMSFTRSLVLSIANAVPGVPMMESRYTDFFARDAAASAGPVEIAAAAAASDRALIAYHIGLGFVAAAGLFLFMLQVGVTLGSVNHLLTFRVIPSRMWFTLPGMCTRARFCRSFLAFAFAFQTLTFMFPLPLHTRITSFCARAAVSPRA